MQLQQLYLTEPPAPRIYLTQSGLFGGFCDQTSGAEMLVYESIVENSGRVYCWVYRPHQRACINGMSIEEQAQFWHEAYAMPRAWFEGNSPLSHSNSRSSCSKSYCSPRVMGSSVRPGIEVPPITGFRDFRSAPQQRPVTKEIRFSNLMPFLC